MFQEFLGSLTDVAPALRSLPSQACAEHWQQEPRPGRAGAWLRDFDETAWLTEGTPLLVALFLLAGKPYADGWQALGSGAAHPDCGFRLYLLRPAGPLELYRIP